MSLPRVTASILLAGAAAACVAEPESPQYEPMCATDDECVAAGLGTRCHEELCVGPAALAFSALLTPPNDRKDLVVTEVTDLTINADGQIENLVFADSVKLTGRVVIERQDTPSVAATLIFRRPSRLFGGGDYVVSTIATKDVLENGSAFEVRLPRGPTNEQWDLTIIPDDGTLYQDTEDYIPPATLAPPNRIRVVADGDDHLQLPLVGTGGLKQIHGYVRDATGTQGLPGMRVRAFGRFLPDGPLELASSTRITDENGYFSILARDEWQDEFEIEVSPGPDTNAPTVRRRGVIVYDTGLPFSEPIDDIVFPPFAGPVEYSIPVGGTTTSGTPVDAAGAIVTLTTIIEPYNADDTAIYTTTATVGVDGVAKAWLIPGGTNNRTYFVDVIPLEGSQIGAVWDRTVEVGPPAGASGGTLVPIALPPRVYVTGRLVDATGLPAANVTVRPELSLPFLLGLDPVARKRCDVLRWPEAQTAADGTFSLYLDGTILGLVPTYDVLFVPPFSTLLPRWTLDGIQVPLETAAFSLDEYTLPGATRAWGVVADPNGSPVEGADVRALLPPGPELCSEESGLDCTPLVRTMARGSSRGDGQIVLILPDGPPGVYSAN